jgi:polysaccharide biosynthesis transport protein
MSYLESNPMNKLFLLGKRYWLPLLMFNSAIMILAAWLILKTPKVWTAHAQLILPEQSNKVAVSLGTLGSLTTGGSDSVMASDAARLEVQKSILLSDVLMEQLWKRDPEKNKLKTVNAYKSLVSVKSSKDSTTILAISVDGSTPEIAKRRAIALLKGYQERLNELRDKNRSVRENYSRDALEQAEIRLEQAQNDLAEFKGRTGLVSNDEQVKGLVNTMNTLTTSLAQSTAQAQSNERRIQVLSERLRLSPDQAVRSLGLGENKDYQFLRQQLVRLEANLITARSKYTDESPAVQKLLEQRTELVQRIQSYVVEAADGNQVDKDISVDSEVGQGRAMLMQQLVLAEAEANSQKQSIQVLKDYLAQLNRTLKTFPGNQERLVDLQRQVEIAEGIYKGLVTQVKQTSVDSFNSYPNVQELDPPVVDDKPSSPKVSASAISALLAALLGSTALILLLEARNPLLRPKDLQRLKFPLVLRIPQLRSLDKPIGLHDGTELEFQRLASSVSLQPTDNSRLLITSAVVNEGKTTVTLKLAIALTDLGFRVLMIDADYRQASLSKRLGFLDTPEHKREPVTIKPGLALLPTGHSARNWVELVTRGQFQQTLLNLEATGQYDYILIDGPPIALTSEGPLLASLIQQALFVVRPGKSERKPVNDSLEQLAQYGVKFLGLVINDSESKSRTYKEYQSNNLMLKS